MQDIQKRFGRRLRQLREAAGLSQEGLAESCNFHRTYVGLIERGERSVSLPNVETIAKTLGVPPSRLFEDMEAKSDTDVKAPRKIAKLPDTAAHLATIRQILIEAKLVDAARYEMLLKEQTGKS